MSAGLIVDLGNQALSYPTIVPTTILSGNMTAPCSGTVVGSVVDMVVANTYCNLNVAGVSPSGQLRVQVQTSDQTTSGSFTDPTSGLAQLPGAFQSGGILWLNSGGAGGGLLGAGTSGQFMASGFNVSQAFQRPGRYARALLMSGDFACGGITVSFISQLKTTGSGGGFSYLPQSGGNTINV